MTVIRSVSVVAAAAFALISTSAASADVVTSTFSGIGSGTWSSGIYSGQSFTNKAFTFTTSVDTSSISAISVGFLAPVAAATVFIEDYGVLAITSATEQAVNQQQRRFGFGLADSGIIVGFNNNAFGSWNMQTNLGPITGAGVFNTETFNTSLGAIQFSGATTITFTSVVPAPGAVALVGLAGLAGSRRRRA
jgi:MYXO-CTERM domain-containing protein